MPNSNLIQIDVDNTLYDIFPVGFMSPFAGATAPNGWMLCDGSEISKSVYANLYSVIGDSWGAASSGNFKLPDMRKRVPVGRDSSDSDFDTLGETGGEKSHTLTVSEMPSHGHGMDHTHSMAHTHSYTGPNTASWKTGTNGTSHTWCTTTGSKTSGGSSAANTGAASITTTGNSGNGTAHNNLQPYGVVNYIIYVGRPTIQ